MSNLSVLVTFRVGIGHFFRYKPFYLTMIGKDYHTPKILLFLCALASLADVAKGTMEEVCFARDFLRSLSSFAAISLRWRATKY